MIEAEALDPAAPVETVPIESVVAGSPRLRVCNGAVPVIVAVAAVPALVETVPTERVVAGIPRFSVKKGAVPVIDAVAAVPTLVETVPRERIDPFRFPSKAQLVDPF